MFSSLQRTGHYARLVPSTRFQTFHSSFSWQQRRSLFLDQREVAGCCPRSSQNRPATPVVPTNLSPPVLLSHGGDKNLPTCKKTALVFFSTSHLSTQVATSDPLLHWQRTVAVTATPTVAPVATPVSVASHQRRQWCSVQKLTQPAFLKGS